MDNEMLLGVYVGGGRATQDPGSAPWTQYPRFLNLSPVAMPDIERSYLGIFLRSLSPHSPK